MMKLISKIFALERGIYSKTTNGSLAIIHNGVKSNTLYGRLLKSLLLCGWVISIGSVVNFISSLSSKDNNKLKIKAAMYAPYYEEAAKSIAAKGKFGIEFCAIFNLIEFTQYVASLKDTKGIVRARLCAVGMHTITSLLHVFANNKNVQEALNADTEEKKEKLSYNAYYAAAIIHTIWNYLSISNKKFISFVFGNAEEKKENEGDDTDEQKAEKEVC